MQPHLFTIDVEDWFHILDIDGAPPLERWDSLPNHVEDGFRRLLSLLDEAGVRATCFFLGWVGARYKHLVREAVAAGHEIASHGHVHRLIYTQTAGEFYEDVRRAKEILEDAGGQEVRGYRAPGFSLVAKTPWALEQIARAGYRYDTSIFPGTRGHGGLPGAPLVPYRVDTPAGALVEIPISVVSALGRRLCFSGGGYLRLLPIRVVERLAQRVRASGRPVMYYVHPRELSPDHPRVPMGAVRRFKSYVNLRGTEAKVRRLLATGPFVTLQEWIDSDAGRRVLDRAA